MVPGPVHTCIRPLTTWARPSPPGQGHLWAEPRWVPDRPATRRTDDVDLSVQALDLSRLPPPCRAPRKNHGARRRGAHLDTVAGCIIRAVAADVSPWQGPPQLACCHRLTSAATSGGCPATIATMKRCARRRDRKTPWGEPRAPGVHDRTGGRSSMTFMSRHTCRTGAARDRVAHRWALSPDSPRQARGRMNAQV